MGEPIAALGGLTWADAELIRHESGRLLFPDKLRRYDAKGLVVETKVRVWVPVPNDHIEARVHARAWFAEKKLDPTHDRAIFEQMEQLCLLARAIRTHDAPHPQLVTHQELAGYDEASLQDIQERINQYKDLIDPRLGVVDDASFWRTVTEVARRQDLLPLADIAPRALRPLLARMAKEALRSPTVPSSASSSESSTPET